MNGDRHFREAPLSPLRQAWLIIVIIVPMASCYPAIKAALAPRGEPRMGVNPHANSGLLLRDLQLPEFRESAVAATGPGAE